MKKLDLEYHDQINLDEIVLHIKNSPMAKQLIVKENISDEEIKKHFELFNQYIKINEKCLTCQSMKDCNHSTKGYQYIIKRDLQSNLTDSLSICKFYHDYYKRKSHLLFTTFNDIELLDDKQKSFVIDNARLLGMDFVNKMILLLKGQKINGGFLQIKDSKIRLKIVKSLSYGLLLNNFVSIVKFSDLLQAIKADFNTNNKANTFKNVLESDILLIDGIGNEAITTWSRDEVLLSLLDNRLQSEKTTIITSEFSLEELKKLYQINNRDEVRASQIIEKINEVNK